MRVRADQAARWNVGADRVQGEVEVLSLSGEVLLELAGGGGEHGVERRVARVGRELDGRRVREPDLAQAGRGRPGASAGRSGCRRCARPSCGSLRGREAGRRPHVVEGVRAPRAPALGVVGVDTERGEADPDPEVRGEEHVGVAEGPHADVAGRPRADARHLDERRPRRRRGRRRGRSGRRPPPRQLDDRAAPAAGIGSRAGSMSASRSADGKVWVSGPPVTASGSPTAATTRPATVLAPATEICWPITARTMVSNVSTLPATRSPGVASTSGRSVGSAARAASMVAASASRSRRRRTRPSATARSRSSSTTSRTRTGSSPSPARGGPPRGRGAATGRDGRRARPRPPRPARPARRGRRRGGGPRTAPAPRPPRPVRPIRPDRRRSA